MSLPAVVEHLDVLKQIGARFCARLVTPMMHALGLETVEEALHHRVVVTVARATHAWHDLVCFQ